MSVRTGGPAINVAALASGLVEIGVEATIYCTNMSRPVSSPAHADLTPSDLPPIAKDVELRIFPSGFPRRFAYSPDLGHEVRRTVATFDLVHLHSLFLYPQAAGFTSAVQAGVPFVVSPRGSLDPWVRRQGRMQKAVANILWQRRLLEKAAAIHVASDGEASYIADIAPAVPRVVLPNGVSIKGLRPSQRAREQLRRELRIGQDEVVALSLGRLSKKKNLDTLIDAFKIAVAERPELVLLVAGPDDEGLECELRRRAQATGHGERIHFLGEVRRERKNAVLSAADVFVMPSHTENFGVALVEALGAGLPAIVSHGVAIAPDVESGGAAITVQSHARPLAAAMSELSANGSRRHAMGHAAQSVARRFEWRELIPRYAEAYKNVVDGDVLLAQRSGRLS